ncbi:MAG: DUF6599 family protein [Deltaproteobacteria bacterium]
MRVPSRSIAKGALLLGIVVLGAGCAARSTLGVPAGSAAVRVPAGDPALRVLAGRGWMAASPVRTFSPDTLYEEIDGEAELYLPYDFRSLSVAVLSRPECRAAEVRIALFRHGSSRDAWGVYSLRRFAGQRLTAVGPSEAIVSDASVEFARGETFVQIGQGSLAASPGDLLEAAQGVADALEGPGGPPPEAAVLAVAPAIRGSTVYQKRAILGYESLAPGFEARFTAGDVSGTLLFIEPRRAPGGPPLTDSLSRDLPAFEPASPGLYRAELRSGTLWLASEQGLFAGVAAPRLTREQAAPILDALRANLAACSKARGEAR